MGGAWTCFKFSMAGQDSSAGAKEEVESNPQKYNIVADGTMQVAGVIANCFKLGDVQGFAIRYCYSAEGVPLYYKTTGTAEGKSFEYEMKAKSYSTSVPDSEFELPASPQELPTIPS